MAAVEGHGLGALDELHPAALPGAVGVEVAAQVVGGELVELRVDARAVVALAVVLGDQLPVRADLVHDLLRRPERGEVEPGHVVDEVAELRLEPRRHRLVGEAQEHEALPGLAPDGGQAVGVEGEVVEVLGVLGAHEAAVELVDPGVVGALEADGLAALALLDRGAPVAAHVVERADLVVPAADQEHALAQHVAHEEAAGLGDLLRAADREPVALQDVLALPVEDRRVLVGPRGQEGGRSVLAADGRELVCGQDRHAGIVLCRTAHPPRPRPGGRIERRARAPLRHTGRP